MSSQPTTPPGSENLVVVLQRPQDGRNVGAVLRAMKNMGFTQLRLVAPEPLEEAAILRVAHHCEDLLARMTTYPTLDEALADATYVVGTAALRHRARAQTADVRQVATQVSTQRQQGKVALLFGQEDDGLDHAALDRCHLLVTLPTNPEYPALNVSQSVLLLLYEVRMAALSPAEVDTINASLATQAELERLFQASTDLLETTGFFKSNRRVTLSKLRQIVYKAALSPEDVALLLAIVRRLARALGLTG